MTGGRLALLMAGLMAAATLTVVVDTATAPEAEAAQSARFRKAARMLQVRNETNRGYDRAKFKHWIDRDGDCFDTRGEVLLKESRVDATWNKYCTVQRGKWRSYYDRRTWYQASDVDIDHLVPLAEAWGSGAKRWNWGTRKRFANDLGDWRSLVAVTDNVNQSKGAQDPSEWLPRYNKCRYVREWVAVKLRWRLKVNRAEKRRVVRIADRCRNKVIRWKRARIVLR